MDKLTELKQRHAAWIARAKANGATILSYRVPCCDATMEDRAAGPGERWDILATCPHCGGLYLKISTADAITALLPETV